MSGARRRWVAAAGAVLLSAVLAFGALAGDGGERGAAVVGVLVERPAGPPARATGFVAGDGRIVTVAHVLDGGGAVSVRSAGGRLAARVVGSDRAGDLALLAVDGLAGMRSPAGSGVRAVAARRDGPRALPVSIRREITAKVRDSAGPTVYSREALELVGEVRAGDSGAPVLDGDGRLLGVIFARSQRRAGTAYAVDAAVVERLLER